MFQLLPEEEEEAKAGVAGAATGLTLLFQLPDDGEEEANAGAAGAAIGPIWPLVSEATAKADARRVAENFMIEFAFGFFLWTDC